jgi:hypothetical protein
MRAKQGLGIGIALFLLFSLVTLPPAAAQRRTQVSGVIVSLNMGKNSFLISQPVQNDQRYWMVKRTAGTRIEIGGQRVAFNRLRRGDTVRVDGRLTASREIQAERVRVTSRGTATRPPVILRPPSPSVPIPVPSLGDVLRITAPPEIIRPANGARVGSDFTVVGRTAPRADVNIEVVPRYLVFDLPSASANVTADTRGVFAHSVQPLVRVSGGAYRVNVKARLLGLESPTASITVYQR